MAEVRVRVDAIVVEGRFRKDLGDLDSLAASIKREKLINPITITPDNRLLAGERRLAAHRLLGEEFIPARVVDTLDDATAALRIERDENTERKPMAVSELVSLGLALEELERPKAAERMLNGRPSAQVGGGSAETREIVSAALGIGHSTYDRARFVVTTATNPNVSEEERSNAQEAVKEMDATGKVSPAYDKVRRMTDRPRTGTPRPAPQRTGITSATDQRQAINAAVVALSGIAYGLGQITEIHRTITSDEAAQWVDGLAEPRRILTQLVKRLKEHTNAQL